MSDILNPEVVTDVETHFVIDPVTREITNKDMKKKVLIQGDHNSERFTFDIPRFIEGRDVAKCNSVQVHYINVGKGGKQTTGVYTVTDLNVYPFIHDMLKCSWLISANATKYEGALSFMLRFAEIVNETEIKYAWHTETYDDIRIAKNINADAAFEEEYVDIIEQWKHNVMDELTEHIDYMVEHHVDVAQIGTNAANIAELEQDLAVQKARMDTFTALPDGYTTNDAALADICVDVNGETYDTPAEAVRGQVEMLQNQLAYGSVGLNNEPMYEFKTGSYAELTIPGDVEIFANGTLYRAEDLTTRFDFAPQSYSLFNIIFNCSTNLLSIQYFRTPIPKNCVIIGQAFAFDLRLNVSAYNIWSTNPINGYNPIDLTVWCHELPTMTYDNGHISLYMPECNTNTGHLMCNITERTIEYDSIGHGLYNILYNRVSDDMYIQHRSTRIPSGYQRLGLIHTKYGVYLNGATFMTNVNNFTVAPLILGNGSKYVEFDSVKKTITFPNDTLVQNNRAFTWDKAYYQLATAKGNNVIDYSHMGSSALVVYYDTLTDSLGVTQYNQTLEYTSIPIATFRTSCGQVSINAPYKWNGRPFNMDGSDYGIPEYDIRDFKTEFLVKSVNHRGYCKEAPENTLSAYRLSAKNGFSYVECDVSFTSDGVPVLLHDATIDRTSNGSGNINDLTLEQVRQYDFGSWFNADYVGEKIPTFEEFIALCRKLSLHPYIEIKSSATYTQEQINQLVSIVQRYGMTGKVTYISFNHTYLGYVKNADSNARLGYVMDAVGDNHIETAKTLKSGTNEVFIDASCWLLDTDMVYRCLNAGFPLEVWTCNDENLINTTLDPYVSGVTSDNIHAGKSLFKANL